MAAIQTLEQIATARLAKKEADCAARLRKKGLLYAEAAEIAHNKTLRKARDEELAATKLRNAAAELARRKAYADAAPAREQAARDAMIAEQASIIAERENRVHKAYEKANFLEVNEDRKRKAQHNVDNAKTPVGLQYAEAVLRNAELNLTVSAQYMVEAKTALELKPSKPSQRKLQWMP